MSKIDLIIPKTPFFSFFFIFFFFCLKNVSPNGSSLSSIFFQSAPTRSPNLSNKFPGDIHISSPTPIGKNDCILNKRAHSSEINRDEETFHIKRSRRQNSLPSLISKRSFGPNRLTDLVKQAKALFGKSLTSYSPAGIVSDEIKMGTEKKLKEVSNAECDELPHHNLILPQDVDNKTTTNSKDITPIENHKNMTNNGNMIGYQECGMECPSKISLPEDMIMSAINFTPKPSQNSMESLDITTDDDFDGMDELESIMKKFDMPTTKSTVPLLPSSLKKVQREFYFF